jgi:hypothetical protein
MAANLFKFFFSRHFECNGYFKTHYTLDRLTTKYFCSS